MSKNRSDYEHNHLVIRKAYMELLAKYKRKPTLSELAEKAKVSLKTVDRHLEDMQFKPLNSSLRILTDDILVSIFQTARKGNVAAQKLWLVVIEGWREKAPPEDEGLEENSFRSMSDEEIDLYCINLLETMAENEEDPKRKVLLNEQIRLEKQISKLKRKLKTD